MKGFYTEVSPRMRRASDHVPGARHAPGGEESPSAGACSGLHVSNSVGIHGGYIANVVDGIYGWRTVPFGQGRTSDSSSVLGQDSVTPTPFDSPGEDGTARPVEALGPVYELFAPVH